MLIRLMAALTLAMLPATATNTIADAPAKPNLGQLMDRDEQQWPDLRGALWALADETIADDERLGVESRLRGALAGSQTQGEVFSGLVRAVTASAAFFENRECAGAEGCAKYRRIAKIFTTIGEDVFPIWERSGAADVIASFERGLTEPGWDDDMRAFFKRELPKRRQLRDQGITGVVSLKRSADQLRRRGELTRAWRVDTIAKAIADHPEHPR